MPYIELEKRRDLHSCRRSDQSKNEARMPVEAGELAYVITCDCLDFLDAQPKRGFLAFATVIGVLICVVLEIYRRIVAPYEDLAKIRNGDVEGMGR